MPTDCTCKLVLIIWDLKKSGFKWSNLIIDALDDRASIFYILMCVCVCVHVNKKHCPITLEAHGRRENNGPDTYFFDPAALLNHSVCLAQNLPVKALSKSHSAWQEELCGSPAAQSTGGATLRVEQAKFKIHFEWFGWNIGFKNLNPCLVLFLLPGFGTMVLKDIAGFIYLFFIFHRWVHFNFSAKLLSKIISYLKELLVSSVLQSVSSRFKLQY